VRAVWAGLGAALAVAIAALQPVVRDPDSTLYAAMSRQLAGQPVRTWLEPVWPAGRAKAGPFLEHTAVTLWPGAALEALGVPAGALVANALGALLLLWLVGRLAEALQLGAGPLAWAAWGGAFIAVQYWLRANHEVWWAAATVAALLGVARGWRGGWVALGAALACAVKGALGAEAVLLVGALAWGLRGPRAAAWLALQALAGAALAVGGYELLHRAATGGGFVGPYLAIQTDYVQQLEGRSLLDKPRNLGMYLLRLAWFSLPGTALAAWRWRQARRQPALALLLGVGLTVLATSLMSRQAARYVFPCYPLLAVAGAVAAADTGLARWLRDRSGRVLLVVGAVALGRVVLGDLAFREVNVFPGSPIQQRRDGGP
jgi:hypothetical protein